MLITCICQNTWLTCARSDDGRPRPAVVRTSHQNVSPTVFESTSSRTRVRHEKSVWKGRAMVRGSRGLSTGDIGQSRTRALDY